MKSEDFKKHLCNNIIPFWNKLRDHEYDGFYGEVDFGLKINKQADKGVILNSRILWFYSNAYKVLKGKIPSDSKFSEQDLLDNAACAFRFLKNACLDTENGGVYWSCTYDGKPSDTQKHTYNQAFAIYALSSYYDVSQDDDVLEIAMSLYDLIEDTMSDEGGYLEAFDKNFEPIVNDQLSENGVIAQRTMNTLLHVIEAYTELYRVCRSKKVGKALTRALKLFEEEIYNESKGICDVFFDIDYNSIIDLESYGHNIEASWLIDRAIKVLDVEDYLTDDLRKRVQAMTSKLCEVAYMHAFDAASGGFNNECENGVVDAQKIWWVQAEAVIGFINGYAKTKEEYLIDAAESVWKYIKQNVVDKRSGEWYESVKADGSLDFNQGLVHEWKCPYHNGRMCLQMMRRLPKIMQ